jgi:hypothetical protein
MRGAAGRYWDAAPGSEQERAAWDAMTPLDKLAHWFLRRLDWRRMHGVA